jgi:phosphatidylserine decarboxylase
MLLGALPKLLLSRTTGVLARLPLPRPLRGPVYRAFARRYGVELGEMQGALADYRCLCDFFVRPLRDGARPIDATSALVWPCDGRIVTAGVVRDGRIEQVKGHDYALADLVLDAELAARLEAGSQATIYLAPRDYHRVHAPFEGQLVSLRRVPGTFYPVNPQTCRSVERVFLRNERVVFAFRLADGRAAAVVMVAALNVGDIQAQVAPGHVAKGQEIGRFALGSTVVALVGLGQPSFPTLELDTVVRYGASASAGA